MKKILKYLSLVLVFPFIGILAGTQCAPPPSSSEENTYSVGGTIYGLNGSLVLADFDSTEGEFDAFNPPTGQTLVNPISYSFTGYAADDTYFIEIIESPERQQCAVVNPTGRVEEENVTDVDVYCGASYTLGGTLSGLASESSVGLRLNTADEDGLINQTLTANGSFTFSNTLPNGFPYVVTVRRSPSGQTCTISNGSGTINQGNVNNIAVTCLSSGFKKIFVTEAAHNGNFGGLAEADAICASQATMSGYSGTYKALLGTSARNTSSNWVLTANTEYVQAGSSKVIGTTNSSAVFTFPLTNSFGTISTMSWTGLTSNWAVSSDNCSDWTDGNVNGNTGNNEATDSTAIAGSIPEYCGFLNTLICVEQ